MLNTDCAELAKSHHHICLQTQNSIVEKEKPHRKKQQKTEKSAATLPSVINSPPPPNQHEHLYYKPACRHWGTKQLTKARPLTNQSKASCSTPKKTHSSQHKLFVHCHLFVLRWRWGVPSQNARLLFFFPFHFFLSTWAGTESRTSTKTAAPRTLVKSEGDSMPPGR